MNPLISSLVQDIIELLNIFALEELVVEEDSSNKVSYLFLFSTAIQEESEGS